MCPALKPVEQDDLVQPVQELGPEMAADDLHHLRLGLLDRLVFAELRQILGAKVRGQDDDGVGEVDGSALSIGEAPVVEHLEKHVEDVAVRLLDLVEKDDLIGPPADGFGKNAAFLVADIAWRSADQPRDRVLFHELAHVDADHRGGIVEQEFGERLGELGLADAGRPEEQE